MEEIKVAKEILKILEKISKDSGYNFDFKDVDITLEEKDIKIIGNK